MKKKKRRNGTKFGLHRIFLDNQSASHDRLTHSIFCHQATDPSIQSASCLQHRAHAQCTCMAMSYAIQGVLYRDYFSNRAKALVCTQISFLKPSQQKYPCMCGLSFIYTSLGTEFQKLFAPTEKADLPHSEDPCCIMQSLIFIS